MVASFVLGVALGAGSSVVPGPCGLAVIHAARHGLGRSLATAGGAALGDASCAALGIVGVGRALARYPAIGTALLALGGAILIIYGVTCLRPRPAPARPSPGVVGGVAVGLLTLLANPGALVTWVVIVGAQLGGLSPAEQWSTVLGIGAGSWAWFFGVAHLAARGHGLHGAAMLRITRLVSCAIVASGVLSLVRAAHG